MSSRLTFRVVIAFRNWSQVTIRGLIALLPFFRSLSARSCSAITVSPRAPVVQAIHPQINKGDRKQALYNLSAAYILTMPREQLIECVEWLDSHVKAWEFELEEVDGQTQLSVGDAGLLAAYFLPQDSKRFACMDIVLLHCIARTIQSCEERAVKLRLTRSVSTRQTRFYERARYHTKNAGITGIFKSCA